jgi:hypothetical protein
MTTRRLFLALLAAGAPALASSSTGSSAAQSCDTTSYPMSSPSDRFSDNRDGTVTDKQSGLMWMRCALGQSWTGSTCAGEPKAFTWQSAQGAASALNQAGGYASHSDWRMPHIPELAMIVERQCANPRINLALFPATPASYFWTATGRRGAGMEAEAYLLSFGAEGASHNPKDDLHYARLVRVGK